MIITQRYARRKTMRKTMPPRCCECGRTLTPHEISDIPYTDRKPFCREHGADEEADA